MWCARALRIDLEILLGLFDREDFLAIARFPLPRTLWIQHGVGGSLHNEKQE